MITLSLDAARKVCEIGLTVIPVFALAFLVSERDKLRVPLGDEIPTSESPEQSMAKLRSGDYVQDSGKLRFVPEVDPSDAIQLASSLPFLLASLTGFVVALLGLIISPGPWLLAIVASCLLVVVFLFFIQVALGFVRHTFRWHVTETTGMNSIPAVLLGRERVYLESTGQDITTYERVGLLAVGVLFFLGVVGVLALIGVNVLILGFVHIG